MKKVIITAVILVTIIVTARPSFSNSFYNDIYSFADNGDLNKEISIVPDRTSGEAQVRFKSVKAGEASIVVLDETGKIVLQQSNLLSVGINSIPIVNILKLNEGFYTVRLITDSKTYNSRFLLWK